jgi:hypothetical protein
MKVIFLDIDGVLNWAGTEDRINGFIGLCSERIQRLNAITDAHPDAKIVVSSTWRKSFFPGGYKDFDGLVQLLHDRGVKAEIIDYTPWRFSYQPRGAEIREWIEDWRQENPGQELVYVVLDDDTDGMEGYTTKPTRFDDPETFEAYTAEDLRPRHVVSTWDGTPIAGASYNEVTHEEGGLQQSHVDLAIAVLSGATVPGPFNGSWEYPEREADDE